MNTERVGLLVENDCVARRRRMTREQMEEELALWTRLSFRLMDLIPAKNMPRAREHFDELKPFYDRLDAAEAPVQVDTDA